MKEELDKKINYIIDLEDEIRREKLTNMEKKLFRFILNVFSFSANALIKLEKLTDSEIEALHETMRRHDEVIKEHERIAERLR
jgi:hypothetical protein